MSKRRPIILRVTKITIKKTIKRTKNITNQISYLSDNKNKKMRSREGKNINIFFIESLNYLILCIGP